MHKERSYPAFSLSVRHYTLRPTDSDSELSNLSGADTVVPATWLTESNVISWCRTAGYSGAHVFSGPDGPIYGPEGYEDNYHGWIDAR